MSEHKHFFKKDNYVFGAFLGIVSTVVLSVIIHFVAVYITKTNSMTNVVVDKFYLFSLLPNIFFIRYYLVNLKLLKTGQSILAVTFAVVLLYFIFIGKV